MQSDRNEKKNSLTNKTSEEILTIRNSKIKFDFAEKDEGSKVIMIGQKNISLY